MLSRTICAAVCLLLLQYVVLRDLRPKVPPFMPKDYSLLMQRCGFDL
jgi:hypothetical protein